MRFLIPVIFLLTQISLHAQTKSDSIQLIRNTVKLYDLDFTKSEADSMLDNVKDFTENYKGMHKTLPTNDIPYPFAFNPLPHGETIPTKQKKSPGIFQTISRCLPIKMNLLFIQSCNWLHW